MRAAPGSGLAMTPRFSNGCGVMRVLGPLLLAGVALAALGCASTPPEYRMKGDPVLSGGAKNLSELEQRIAEENRRAREQGEAPIFQYEED